MIPRHVRVIVDRPLGSRHPQYPDMIYPVNYGYVEGVFAPDGEEQDVYILGVDTPLQTFEGCVAAVIHRSDDIEDKWVAVPDGMSVSAEQIASCVRFQEQYFHSEIRLLER